MNGGSLCACTHDESLQVWIAIFHEATRFLHSQPQRAAIFVCMLAAYSCSSLVRAADASYAHAAHAGAEGSNPFHNVIYGRQILCPFGVL